MYISFSKCLIKYRKPSNESMVDYKVGNTMSAPEKWVGDTRAAPTAWIFGGCENDLDWACGLVRTQK